MKPTHVCFLKIDPRDPSAIIQALTDERDEFKLALNNIYHAFESGESHAVVLAEIAAEALGIATDDCPF